MRTPRHDLLKVIHDNGTYERVARKAAPARNQTSMTIHSLGWACMTTLILASNATCAELPPLNKAPKHVRPATEKLLEPLLRYLRCEQVPLDQFGQAQVPDISFDYLIGTQALSENPDGVRLFRIRGADSATLLLGSVPPCVPSQGTGLLLGKQPVACVNADDRLVAWGPGNHAIYTITGGLAATYNLVIEPGPPASVRFQPMTTELADQPLALRRAILASVSDLRVWQPRGEGLQNGQTATPSRLGIPTSRGVMVSKEMMVNELTHPSSGALHTPEDVFLSELFGSHTFGSPSGYSAGRIGVDGVVIKDWRVALTHLAHYDAGVKKLTQNIAVKGLPERAHQTIAESQTEYVFNDQNDGLYLFQGWSGDVYSINEQFSAKLVASLPTSSSLSALQIASGAIGSAQGPVRSAVKTPAGRLVLATPAGVFVQIGVEFAQVPAPEAVLQLVAVNEVEVLAVAKGGLAKLSLPR